MNSANKSNAPIPEQEDRLPLILSFLLPIIIMLGILAGKNIFPFGENSFLRTDLYHQYAPFFAEFARLLKEGGSLTYSFDIGLGSNFVALFAYYLSSPFNWLLILVPSGLVIEFMTYLIVLKIGLCGLTMATYLRCRFHKDSLSLTLIGLCYALSGYMAAYSWNIMWLDCLWLAPLILLGLERLVHRNRPLLYCVTLGLAILCNYYISIMLCIFMVLYFICEMILLPRQKLVNYLKKAGLFALFSLIAGGLAAIVLIPAIHALMTTASADSTFPKSLTSYFSLLEMLARQMVNVEVEIGLDHWPNLYSGVFCMLLFPAYLLNQKVPAKEKIVKSTLLALMLLSFSLNIPNYIWHGMHYPNSLPCRQSFLYTIVLLTCCFEGLQGLKDLTKGQIVACFWGVTTFILICQTIITADEFDYYVYYLSLLFIAMYTLLSYLAKTGVMLRSTALILALGLLVAETGMNTAVTSVTTTNRTEYWKNTRNYQALLEQADVAENGYPYRVEKTSRRSKNDAAWTGYRSASIFSSTTQSSISDFYKLFGMEGNTNAYSFTGATPLVSSLLSVRYLLSSTELEDSDLYEPFGTEDTAYMYRNLYTQALGFMIPSDVSEYFEFFSDDPASAQNSLVNLTTGSGDVLEEIASNWSGDTFSFTTPEKGNVFVYVENSSIGKVRVTSNSLNKSFDNVNRGYLLDLGICEEGESISLSADGGDEGETMDAVAYLFNNDAFIDWYNRSSMQSLQVESWSNSLTDTSLTGTITATEDGVLFTSIPYDKGWHVLLDGEPVDTTSFAGTFLALELTEGTHMLAMSYHVPGLQTGTILSLLSLLLLIGMLYTFAFLQTGKKPVLHGRRRTHHAALPEEHRHISEELEYEEPPADSLDSPDSADEIQDIEEEIPLRTNRSEDGDLSDEEIAEILLEDEEYLDSPDEIASHTLPKIDE